PANARPIVGAPRACAPRARRVGRATAPPAAMTLLAGILMAKARAPGRPDAGQDFRGSVSDYRLVLDFAARLRRLTVLLRRARTTFAFGAAGAFCAILGSDCRTMATAVSAYVRTASTVARVFFH